jgi:hypothetical protein
MKKYFGVWGSRDEVADTFEEPRSEFPSDSEILFASYDTQTYEGRAQVLFARNGSLFEVSGSHCSCFGLEQQWKPGTVSWEALAMRPRITDEYAVPAHLYSEAERYLQQLVALHLTINSRLPEEK